MTKEEFAKMYNVPIENVVEVEVSIEPHFRKYKD